MFETSLVESTNLLRTTDRRPALISAAAQFLAVAAIIALPLLHPGVLAPRHFDLAMIRPMPIPPPPIVMPTPVNVRVIPTVQPTNVVTLPTTQPRINRSADSGPAPTPVGLNLSNSTGFTTSNPLSGIGTGGPGPNITVANTSPTSNGNGTTPVPHTGPTNISTGVSAGLLLEPIRPIYPAIAKAAHRSGIVTVAATISTTGRIESAHATSGPTMLQSAAVDAIRVARYRPFLLNGQPTEVNATFSIHFNLNE